MHMLPSDRTVMAELETACGYWVPSISMPMFATKRLLATTHPSGDNSHVEPIHAVLESNPMTRVIFLGALVLMAHALASCSDGKPVAAAAPPPPPVTVARPLQKTITEWDEYTGRFVAVETWRSAQGFPASSIPYISKTARSSSRATFCSSSIRAPTRSRSSRPRPIVERAKAKLEIATLDVQRATPLVRSQTVTEREFDTRRVNRTRRRRPGRLGRGALKQAELNLEWTEVRAPISGRISDRRVDRRQSDHRRSDRRDAADRHRIDRPDPLRIRRQRGGLLALSRGSPQPGRGPRPATCRIRLRSGSRTRPNTSIRAGWISSTTCSIRGRAPFAAAPSSTTRMDC